MYDSNKIKCYVGHTVNTEIYHGVSPDVVGVRLFSILFSVLDFGDRSSVFSHARNNISLRRGCFFFLYQSTKSKPTSVRREHRRRVHIEHFSIL